MFSSEHLTTNFYLWEQRGRGWDVWDFPVELEPPFEPFYHSYNSTSANDDGRKPTALSSFADSVIKFFRESSEDTVDTIPEEPSELLLPSPFECPLDMKELAIGLPVTEKVNPEYAEELLLNLGSCSWPLSFEVIGGGDAISVQVACRVPDLVHVRQQLKAYHPEVSLKQGIGLQSILEQRSMQTVIVDCALDQEFMRPLRTFRSFDPDPLVGIYAVLESLSNDETGLVQILFQVSRNPWASSIMRSVCDSRGDPFFADAPEMLPLAKEKTRRPLFSVILRVVAQSSSQDRAWEIAKNLVGGLTTFSQPESNSLIPLTNDGYDNKVHLDDVILRQSHRNGMLLSSEELTGIIHLPSSSVKSLKLRGQGRKTRAVPSIGVGHRFILGENVHQGVAAQVSLSTEQRIRHIHIIGATGTGKSTLLIRMVLQDIALGNGCAILDPHGDLIDAILERVPENRVEDVILLDPGDTNCPVGFNVLQAHSEIEKTIFASDLVAIFRRFSTSWGDQMSTVLSNALAAIAELKGESTLLELKRFLMEDEYRESVIHQCSDPVVKYFWEKEFPLLRGNSIMSIITRLDALLRSKILRDAIAARNGLNFRNIIDTGKILLVKLPQGIIGEENSYILGSLICSKLHQAVMSRQEIPAGERKPYFCYIDEFQHFATPSLASILSGSRKYAFGLILAHQDLHQIIDPALQSSVVTNPATRICFALGESDAHKLGGGFKHFEAADLMNLGVGEAIVRIERSDYNFNLTTDPLPVITPDVATMKREKIVASVRARHGKQPPSAMIPESPTESVRTFAPPVRKTEMPYLPSVEKREPYPPPIPNSKKTVVVPDEHADKKRQSQHRYLQTLIKQMAEQRGYRAVIEAPTPDGKGRVDVGLEKGEERIAIEISVTTGDIQELHNIEKCLKSGWDPVIVCSPERKSLEAIRKRAAEKLSPSDCCKVLFFEPEELYNFLENRAMEETGEETTLKGYRVKVQYHVVSEAEGKRKRETIGQMIAQSMRHLK